MDPDVVEISPPHPLASTSRTRKPRKVNLEVIDVEQYHVDKMNKGKAVGVIPMDVDGYTVVLNDIPTGVQVAISTNGSNPFLAAPSTTVQHQTPNVVMEPSPSSRPVNCDDASASSEAVTSAQANYLRDFKRFDTVDDFSDHHYASKGKASKQHSKTWLKKVQEDWKILEKDLPETIFVRACESRMDLMRAVIIGAEGTPYHDGLFFFDIQFPDNYPSVPPKVHYHSGGLRINPNLYNCGKVCLSLLGTWTGNKREKWLPQESTMLQLLVSIQALILNQKPYFNEPGYEATKGTTSGEAHSKVYSENVFILSLKTMVYSMRKPPKHFEEFVLSHYFVKALDIVRACNAYKNGAPVGSIVKGGVQGIEETSQSGSKKFRTDVAAFTKTVAGEFVKLGVKELEEKPKPPPVVNANTESNTANRKRSRSSSIKEFLANIGRCVFQLD
ncbi:putative ubiquitin-conjugating enzyme E2 38 [Raphanus sativus]|uniref:E2 ubiquitin-conjugating enzyme n=1 Tax=Raphanus sativus TaxID=3726 RepID=A0A9W3D0J8_RAPSA|nr:putative ubiquitin-conjugating enzyme E2 38 [Raphanus sativus]